jgi:uncharacterized protein (TIGR00730 family)
MSKPFGVAVYCGSRPGARPAYLDAARAAGAAIARRGWRVVYGGGRVGLMGAVADAALATGGEVSGVIPRLLMEREVGHRGLHELRVVETMHERKRAMAEQADAFLVLPGGIGTLDELFEVWTWRQLGMHDQPIALVDADGYWQPLLAALRHLVAEGFFDEAMLAVASVHDDAESALEALARRAASAAGVDDYRRT